MLLRSKFTARTMATLVTIFTSISLVAGQTQITAPNNKYSPSDDVKMGRDAARQVEQQMPLLRDSRVDEYVQDLGNRLVDAIPPEFRHSEFHYSFKVVNV